MSGALVPLLKRAARSRLLVLSEGSSPGDASEWLLLLCLLLRSSLLTVEGDRHVGAAGVLHRRGGRADVAVR